MVAESETPKLAWRLFFSSRPIKESSPKYCRGLFTSIRFGGILTIFQRCSFTCPSMIELRRLPACIASKSRRALGGRFSAAPDFGGASPEHLPTSPKQFEVDA